MTFKQELKAWAKRYDVIFSFGGMLIGSAMLYADKAPWWGLACMVFLRETFGFLGLLAKSKDEE